MGKISAWIISFLATYNTWPFIVWIGLNVLWMIVGSYYFFFIDTKPNPFARMIGAYSDDCVF